jgi:hypothetical protein
MSEVDMADRSNSRVLGMRIPIKEYEALLARANSEHRTVGGLALELMRKGNAKAGPRRAPNKQAH